MKPVSFTVVIWSSSILASQAGSTASSTWRANNRVLKFPTKGTPGTKTSSWSQLCFRTHHIQTGVNGCLYLSNIFEQRCWAALQSISGKPSWTGWLWRTPLFWGRPGSLPGEALLCAAYREDLEKQDGVDHKVGLHGWDIKFQHQVPQHRDRTLFHHLSGPSSQHQHHLRVCCPLCLSPRTECWLLPETTGSSADCRAGPAETAPPSDSTSPHMFYKHKENAAQLTSTLGLGQYLNFWSKPHPVLMASICSRRVDAIFRAMLSWDTPGFWSSWRGWPSMVSVPQSSDSTLRSPLEMARETSTGWYRTLRANTVTSRRRCCASEIGKKKKHYVVSKKKPGYFENLFFFKPAL